MLDDQAVAAGQNRVFSKMFQADPDKIHVVGGVHENEVKRVVRFTETVETGSDIPTDDTCAGFESTQGQIAGYDCDGRLTVVDEYGGMCGAAKRFDAISTRTGKKVQNDSLWYPFCDNIEDRFAQSVGRRTDVCAFYGRQFSAA